MSTKIERIAELARQDQRMKFTSLAHLLTPEYLKECFQQLNRHGAPGVDGVSITDFSNDLDQNIDQLWKELRSGTYKATSVRRVYIPKGNGKTRSLGIPTVRDRAVQRAVGGIISSIYEPYFVDNSCGFRPNRSTHLALEKLRKNIDRNPIRIIVDADIEAYFDTVNHKWMMEFLRDRISDKSILRLVGKWLKSGTMENGVVVRNEEGTPQGGPISPLLANIYLHYVLDLWFEHGFKPTCRGECSLVRYADDFIVCFAHRGEAERFLKLLTERFAKFGLRISAEKTQLVSFGKYTGLNRRPGPKGEKQTFDFLGFTHYMRKRPKRGWKTAKKPSRKSRNKFLRSVKEWLLKHRDKSVWFHSKVLAKKLEGYYNYFGSRHCLWSLRHVKWHVERVWISILRRRSQRHRLWWSKISYYPWYNLPAAHLARHAR